MGGANIHPSALVAAGARLGSDIVIGPYAVIENDVVLGDGCRIASHAVIKRRTRMGARNSVAEHAVIGGDPQDFKFRDCDSTTEIGDGNSIREGVTIHRGSRPGSATRVGSRCYLMAYCHVAHDCQVGNDVVIVNSSNLAGEVVVGDRAFISGGVGVHQFCRIGRNAMIGGLARISQDALPFCITEGSPARARGLNRVGLKRSGFPISEITALKQAYRLLDSPGLGLREALERMTAIDSAAVAELKIFIQESRRGFAHPKAGGD